MRYEPTYSSTSILLSSALMKHEIPTDVGGGGFIVQGSEANENSCKILTSLWFYQLGEL